MGFERRHRSEAPGREDLAASLARAHHLEPERAREVLRRAERANPEGESFDSKRDGTGKVRIDLAYVAPKNIHDVSTRKGQDVWSFTGAKGPSAVQAIRDVVRTSEVVIRGRIPGKAILEHF